MSTFQSLNTNTHTQTNLRTTPTLTPEDTYEAYAALVSNNMQLRFMLGREIPAYKTGFYSKGELQLA